MNIEQAKKHFLSLGLHVFIDSVIDFKTDARIENSLTIVRRIIRIGNSDVCEDCCYLFPWNSSWCFKTRNGLDGGSVDNVSITELSFDLALLYTESFFFAAPLVIEEWVFPLHKRPDWDSSQIRTSFDNAKTLTGSEWRVVYAKHLENLKPLPYKAQFSAQYREIESNFFETDCCLWARNDLCKMYFAPKSEQILPKIGTRPSESWIRGKENG